MLIVQLNVDSNAQMWQDYDQRNVKRDLSPCAIT